jgi:hypothetical protein
VRPKGVSPSNEINSLACLTRPNFRTQSFKKIDQLAIRSARAEATKVIDQKFRALVAEWSRDRISAGPIGPQLVNGRGYCVVGWRTVQLVRIGNGRASEFAVIVLFSLARLDLRFPPLRFRTLTAARRGALDRAREASGGCPIEFPATWSKSIEFVRCGDLLCFEAL